LLVLFGRAAEGQSSAAVRSLHGPSSIRTIDALVSMGTSATPTDRELLGLDGTFARRGASHTDVSETQPCVDCFTAAYGCTSR